MGIPGNDGKGSAAGTKDPETGLWVQNSDEPLNSRQLGADGRSARRKYAVIQSELDKIREAVKPVLDFYRGELAEHPELTSRNTMAAMLLATLEHMNARNSFIRTLDMLRQTFGHDHKTVHNTATGDFQIRLTAALEESARIAADKRLKRGTFTELALPRPPPEPIQLDAATATVIEVKTITKET